MLMKLASAKYAMHPDRDPFAGVVKAETISVLDSDGQFTSPEVVREMARILLRDGALQIGPYTGSTSSDLPGVSEWADRFSRNLPGDGDFREDDTSGRGFQIRDYPG
jgi:hypothetical protein